MALIPRRMVFEYVEGARNSLWEKEIDVAERQDISYRSLLRGGLPGCVDIDVCGKTEYEKGMASKPLCDCSSFFGASNARDEWDGQDGLEVVICAPWPSLPSSMSATSARG